MEAYEIKEVRPGIFSLDEGGVRSFVVAGADALLIDAGFGKGDIREAARRAAGADARLLLTHADPDHTFGAPAFARAMIHPAEKERFFKKCPAFKGEIDLVNDGDTVNAGAYAFRVLHLPGHTPGSIALFCEKERFLIAGDTVQAAPVFLFGEGRDIPAYVQSLARLRAMANKLDKIYAAHGETPVAPDFLDDLYFGAQRLLAGELEGKDPPMPLPCKVYASGRARFLAGARAD